MTEKLALLALAIVFVVAAANPATALGIRPYVRLGYLLTEPSASDLGFLSLGGDVEEGHDVQNSNYGAGVQFLLTESSSTMKGARFGLDFGIQKLFSAEYTGAYDALHKDDETSLAVLCLVEFAPGDSPFFLQMGLGFNLIYWSWEYEYTGTTYEYEEASGTATALAAMVAAGARLKLNDTMALPIMLRLDNVFRYGSLATVSAVVALDFTI